MRVAILPDWRGENPYQRLLAEALSPLGVQAVFPAGYRRGLPISRTLLRGERPDVLHLHWPSAYLRSHNPLLRSLYCLRTLLDLALVRRAGIPLVWTVHNIVSHDTSTPRVERWFSTRLAAMASRLIVHSESARQEVMARLHAPAEKIAVIRHGTFRAVYGPAPPREEARARLGLPQDVPVVLFFGLIRPYKGVPDLLRAWRYLDNTRGKALLLIKGNAPDPAHAAEIMGLAKGLEDVTLDLRHIPDAEVPLLMAAATVMVLPFRQSLTSGTVRLAQDYGLTVVAPRVSGTDEAERAVVASSTEAAPLADAILRGILLPSLFAQADEDWSAVALSHKGVLAAACGRMRSEPVSA